MTKAEIIEETANYYNLTNRGFDPHKKVCEYLDNKGRSCAVGRCLTGQALHVAKNYEGGVDGLADYLKCKLGITFDEVFKEQYKGHELKFWDSLQLFHDTRHNFKETGLSTIGQKEKQQLLNKWSDS